jgi:hypothetical protein
MPNITLNVPQSIIDNAPNALSGYNSTNPSQPITGLADFAVTGLAWFENLHLVTYQKLRVQSVQQQMLTCSDAVWSQITGLLGPGS